MSAASETVRTKLAAPACSFSCMGVPWAMILPLSITTMSSASWSASSRYCVVSSNVVPWATRPRNTSQSSERLRGSSPVVGSSRNSTGGLASRLTARSRRRRIPPEYDLTCLLAASVSENCSSSSSPRRASSRRPMPYNPPIMRMFSRPDRISSTVAACPVRPMLRRTASGSAMTSCPAMRAVPLVGGDSVVIMRTVVVFPAPLGPSRPRTEPWPTVKLTPSTAVKSPKRLTRSMASMAMSASWVGRWAFSAGAVGEVMFLHAIGVVRQLAKGFRHLSVGWTRRQTAATPPTHR